MIDAVLGHSFWNRTMGPDAVILDLGANVGEFSSAMVARYGCTCHAVEMSALLHAQIPSGPRLRAHHFAIAGRSGRMAFGAPTDDPLSASLLIAAGTHESFEVEALSLEDLARQLGVARLDLVKMDIEGAEVQAIDACSDDFLRGVSQLSVEFHDFNGLVDVVDIKRILGRLRTLGFEIYFPNVGSLYYDVLALNRQLVPVTAFERAWLHHVLRWWNFAGRLASRAATSARARVRRLAHVDGGRASWTR